MTFIKLLYLAEETNKTNSLSIWTIKRRKTHILIRTLAEGLSKEYTRSASAAFSRMASMSLTSVTDSRTRRCWRCSARPFSFASRTIWLCCLIRVRPNPSFAPFFPPILRILLRSARRRRCSWEGAINPSFCLRGFFRRWEPVRCAVERASLLLLSFIIKKHFIITQKVYGWFKIPLKVCNSQTATQIFDSQVFLKVFSSILYCFYFSFTFWYKLVQKMIFLINLGHSYNESLISMILELILNHPSKFNHTFQIYIGDRWKSFVNLLWDRIDHLQN